MSTAPVDGTLALATPTQFGGDVERWDYGVGIANTAVPAWRNATLVAAVDNHGSISPSTTHTKMVNAPVVLLKRLHTVITNRNSEKNHDTNGG